MTLVFPVLAVVLSGMAGYWWGYARGMAEGLCYAARAHELVEAVARPEEP